jgi:hypothetical protein
LGFAGTYRRLCVDRTLKLGAGLRAGNKRKEFARQYDRRFNVAGVRTLDSTEVISRKCILFFTITVHGVKSIQGFRKKQTRFRARDGIPVELLQEPVAFAAPRHKAGR